MPPKSSSGWLEGSGDNDKSTGKYREQEIRPMHSECAVVRRKDTGHCDSDTSQLDTVAKKILFNTFPKI